MSILSSNIGYPRLGEKRELKFLLENFWQGKIQEDEFMDSVKIIRQNRLKKQKKLGIDCIPSGDFSLYDHVLDVSVALGVVPKRFGFDNKKKLDLKEYFSLARGNEKSVAVDMKKWFNTNYHYLVPEFDDVEFNLVHNFWLEQYLEAKQELNITTKPVLLGPISFLKLGKINGRNIVDDEVKALLPKLLPVYVQILRQMQEAKVQWVQIDEPYLVKDESKEDISLYEEVFSVLHKEAPQINILLQTYFESIDSYRKITSLRVQGIGLDFCNDHGENLKNIISFGFPEDKILYAGVINGRNIWKSNLEEKINLINTLKKYVSEDRIFIQPSNSLLHVPVTTKYETNLKNLAFADEKLEELRVLSLYFNEGLSSVKEELNENINLIQELKNSIHRNNESVKKELESLVDFDIERKSPFNKRIILQEKELNLPILPTTTIGSFPQSKEVRQLRSKWKKGLISDEEYENFINEEIKRWIKIQEDLDIDVLVHGEFERTDMVEYFGQKLDGFFTTQNGWVQSYGARAVKPPVIFGDISYKKPMTVKETVFAQSLTKRPVKGMLTAPITIINWSFVRDDIPKNIVANQIALALRKEVKELENNGIKIIQVDEAALREGLPLKRKYWEEYLNNAVYAFKLTTTCVEDKTQIHTHMCYSNFEDIIDTISSLDADVISIETSRSQGELVSVFKVATYDKQIGLGVYDIHSPRIPTVEEIQKNISNALQAFEIKQFWINPDCGLKTRSEKEAIDALKNMVMASKNIRNKYK